MPTDINVEDVLPTFLGSILIHTACNSFRRNGKDMLLLNVLCLSCIAYFSIKLEDTFLLGDGDLCLSFTEESKNKLGLRK